MYCFILYEVDCNVNISVQVEQIRIIRPFFHSKNINIAVGPPKIFLFGTLFFLFCFFEKLKKKKRKEVVRTYLLVLQLCGSTESTPHLWTKDRSLILLLLLVLLLVAAAAILDSQATKQLHRQGINHFLQSQAIKHFLQDHPWCAWIIPISIAHQELWGTVRCSSLLSLHHHPSGHLLDVPHQQQ